MNPLDRNLTPSNQPQDAQASNSQPVANPLQASIANVGAASSSQLVTVPSTSGTYQFLPVLSHPKLVQTKEGHFFHIFDHSNQQVTSALSYQHLSYEERSKLEQINAHKTLLQGIRIPVFKNKLKLNFITSENRQLLQQFFKEVFTRLEGLIYDYDRENFIGSLLMQADRQYLNCQVLEGLKKIIKPYIPNPTENIYIRHNWNIDWPYSRYILETQDPEYYSITDITPAIKKSIYLKVEELDNIPTQLSRGRYTKRPLYINAAFAYGAPPSVVEAWVREGKKLHQAEIARAQQPSATRQAPKATRLEPSASAQAPLSLGQAQAATFNSGVVVNDEQRPGPSRSTPTPLRFEPYQRPQLQAPSIGSRVQSQAAGLTTEELQAFNLDVEPDATFNTQMGALSWPRVTSAHFVREQGSGRYVIMPTMRMEIGRFIIENCLPDARVYRFAALRYGVSLGEIASWVSEASN